MSANPNQQEHAEEIRTLSYAKAKHNIDEISEAYKVAESSSM